MIEVDARTLVILFAGIVAAALVVGLCRAAGAMLLRVATGVVLALALDPVVTAVRRRLQCRRWVAVVAVTTLLLGVFATLVVVMGPSAVRQAERFGSELPDTVRELYGLPVLGERLRDADAATRVERWLAELRGVQLSGTVELVDDVERICEVFAGLMVKYEGLDPEHVESVKAAYRARAPKQRALRLHVTRTVSWDHAKQAGT